MTSEQFNKLENVVKKATYLVDNIEAKEGSLFQTAITVQRASCAGHLGCC